MGRTRLASARRPEGPDGGGTGDRLSGSEHVDTKRRAGTAAHYRDILNRLVVPALGTMKADRVTRAELAKLHLKWKKTPYQANRALAVVGSMYGFGSKHGLAPDGMNPARGIERYSGGWPRAFPFDRRACEARGGGTDGRSARHRVGGRRGEAVL